MTEKMLVAAGEIMRIIDSLEDSDRATVLAMIESRYSKSSGSVKSPSRGKKGGQGGGATKPVPKKEQEEATEPDLLIKVMLRLKPLIEQLPKVTRQQGSEKPHMDLKSVQKRLNRKRAELQKGLSALADQPDEAFRAYESLNKIQAFRIAAKDASVTKGCRLATDPIPSEWNELLSILEETLKSLKESGAVSSNGFFTDEDHNFSPPSIEGETRRGTEQTTSEDEVAW
jgi:hypothetical protein